MKHKLNIILDLDQTLISSEEIHLLKKSHKKKMDLFNNKNLDDQYIVFERPGLQSFLDYLFENFNVSVCLIPSINWEPIPFNGFLSDKFANLALASAALRPTAKAELLSPGRLCPNNVSFAEAANLLTGLAINLSTGPTSLLSLLSLSSLGLNIYYNKYFLL